jgi:hypothetical protein
MHHTITCSHDKGSKMLPLADPKVVQINTLPPHAWFIPFDDPNQPIPELPETSSKILSLTGRWLF